MGQLLKYMVGNVLQCFCDGGDCSQPMLGVYMEASKVRVLHLLVHIYQLHSVELMTNIMSTGGDGEGSC